MDGGLATSWLWKWFWNKGFDWCARGKKYISHSVRTWLVCLTSTRFSIVISYIGVAHFLYLLKSTHHLLGGNLSTNPKCPASWGASNKLFVPKTVKVLESAKSVLSIYHLPFFTITVGALVLIGERLKPPEVSVLTWCCFHKCSNVTFCKRHIKRLDNEALIASLKTVTT